jgi:hypothetical protein
VLPAAPVPPGEGGRRCTVPPSAPANTKPGRPGPTLPASWYAATTAPTGLAFCVHCGLGADTEGALINGTYKSKELRRVTLDASRGTVVSEAQLLTDTSGVLSVVRGPQGAIWFTDGNSLRRVTLCPDTVNSGHAPGYGPEPCSTSSG